ncbi:MAG: outer membrane beta-barrel family protein [Bacteroidales bacterium]|nr:outer membrane beta-barrel family protein [Bacteroidales bacterium]
MTITPALSAEVITMSITGMRERYCEIKPLGTVSVALRQLLLKNKMSIGLTFNDIFNTYNMNDTSRYDHVVLSRKGLSGQSFGESQLSV